MKGICGETHNTIHCPRRSSSSKLMFKVTNRSKESNWGKMFIHLLFALYVALATNHCEATTACVNCPSYIALSAQQKEQLIYNRAKVGAITSNFVNEWPNSAIGIFSEDMEPTFDRFADENSRDRKRVIHSRAALATVRYEVVPNTLGLTGIYSSGAQSGVIRLSLAGEPPSFSPGFGLKFFINGHISANLIGMFSLDGQGTDYNFFRNQLKTRVADPTTTSFFGAVGAAAGKARFESGGKPATQLSPDQPSYYKADGTSSSDAPQFPQALYLVPNATLKDSLSSAEHDFRSDLISIPSGSHLYTVYATMDAAACDKCGNGSAEPCPDVFAVGGSCVVQAIGKLYVKEKFVVSPYVDDRIFFQHSRVQKKSRRTCLYTRARQDTDKDSTVLPNVEGQLADCRSATFCPISANKGKSGCPLDNFENGVDVSSAEEDNPNFVPDPVGSGGVAVDVADAFLLGSILSIMTIVLT